MHSAKIPEKTRRLTLSLVLAVAAAAVVQLAAWKVAGRVIEPSAWALYAASAMALVFLPKHASRPSGSRVIHVGLQCLFLATILTLYDQSVALLAMVPPARYRRDAEGSSGPGDPHQMFSAMNGKSGSSQRFSHEARTAK